MSGLEGGPEKVVKLSDRGRGEGREPFLRRSPSSICQIRNRIIELGIEEFCPDQHIGRGHITACCTEALLNEWV